jgi:putative chitinase
MGNGDEASKDGWNYRGKGFVQLTGKSNYQLYKDHSGIDVVTNPELLLLSANAMDSSGWFFAVLKNLNPIADMGKEDYVIEKITRSVNGALNGIESRKQFFHNILDSTE